MFALIVVLCPVALLAQNAENGTDSVQADNQLYLIVKINNVEYVGYILNDDGREILIDTKKLGKIYIPKTDEIFSHSDLILMPTTPDVAFKRNGISDPVQMYLQDIFTVHANISGNPAISIPLGKHSCNLPFGIQLMANRQNEQKLLNGSRLLEKLLK